ncbi:helix-turn-helix transcriptional regulator [Roseibium aestuarii]|uniref:Helix-turn-helix transcriptional regulator n=1 Tax=Roseibium aestuarii TaxID=2600299 RepID=A0ABW4JS66_9HYPH|nr:helix-turn-helix transcriptional regulator [Roseibium aestuarii]
MTTALEDHEQGLRDGFFEAALDADQWEGALARFSEHLNGGAVNLILLEKAGALPVDLHYERVDEHAYTRYISDYIETDPRVPRVLNAPVNTVLLERDVLTEGERRHSAIYNDLMARSGMRNQAISLLASDTLFAGFGIAPRDDSQPFATEDLARLTRLLPSLKQAVRLHTANQSLQMQRSSLGDLWGLSGKGIVLLGASRQLLYANSLADDLLRAGVLRRVHGQVSFGDRASEQRWQHAWQELRKRGGTSSDQFLTEPTPGGTTFGVRLFSSPGMLGRLAWAGAPAVVMLLTPLSDMTVISAAEIQRFCALFSITPAEARVVEAVCQGQQLSDLAQERQVAVDTLRKQLKSAMAKCGVSSQKDLISRLERFCFLTSG